MTLAELLDQVGETLALTATKLKAVADKHNDIERRLAKLESRVAGSARGNSSVTVKPAGHKVVTSSGWQGRSEYVNIHAHIANDVDLKKAVDLLKSNGFEVISTGRQGE